MRQNQNTTYPSNRSTQSRNAVASVIAFLIVSCSITGSDLLACNHSEISSGCELAGTVRDYKGKIQSIAMWQDRSPREASSLREINSRPVLELVFFLKKSPEFQVVLEKLESDRQQTYVRESRKTYVADPDGNYVRETGVALWVPWDSSSKLGIYPQRSGEKYFYSNYVSGSARDLRAHYGIKKLSAEAKFHVLIHTHPWGTVPSDHDQATARRGVISMVLSEKDGEPTAYVFSAAGSVWELPTRLFKSNAAKEAPVLVAQN